MTQAIGPDEQDSLILWAESPEEARNYLSRADRHGVRRPDRIFVAKSSGRQRHNKYVGGEYYKTSDDDAVDTFNVVVEAPSAITDLVQWCTCDIMLSRGDVPILVLEDTTHVVRMNLYQRFPRLIRASMAGVPAVILQGTRGLDLRLRGDRWALYRYFQPFITAFVVHADTPPVPIWYLPTPKDELRAERDAMFLAKNIIDGDAAGANLRIENARDRVTAYMQAAHSRGEVPPDIASINHSGNEVVVRVGAKPDKVSWRKKGSGQMDPYVGMILAAKYAYCFDITGKQVKPLVVEFTYLPPDFWFFANPETSALYKTLPLQFPDKVQFLG